MDEAVIQFRQWFVGLEVVPTIKALREKIRTLAAAEMQKTLSQMTHLSVDDQKSIEKMLDATINKILHDPTQYLKANGCRSADRSLSLDIARKLFKLDNLPE